MIKKTKFSKKIVIVILFILLLIGVTGCSSDSGEIRVESSGWIYIKHNRGRDGISLVNLRDDSLLTEEGVLYIPTEVDGHIVVSVTGTSSRSTIWFGGGSSPFWAPTATKIVIPEGVAAERLFWGRTMPWHVEFQAEIPDERNDFWGVGRPYVIIIPDGSLDLYWIQFIESRPWITDNDTLIERSDWLAQNN